VSLDKAIKHGKEHRRSYEDRGKPGRYDTTCRPRGAGTGWPCPYCERNRAFRSLRALATAQLRAD
jgi:hypothetical protein